MEFLFKKCLEHDSIHGIVVQEMGCRFGRTKLYVLELIIRFGWGVFFKAPMLKDGYGHDECLALPVIMGKPLGAAQKSKKKTVWFRWFSSLKWLVFGVSPPSCSEVSYAGLQHSGSTLDIDVV